jgi:NAD(P)-dependent dehydrogenase (short-subunit alcohol dehydrogenase family)
MKLSGKVAIVTGGAMGNGLGIVKTFLRYGARVIVIDYSDKLTESLKAQDNSMLLGYQADLREKEVVEAIVEDVIEKFGKIDILVNNAGVAQLVRFLEMDDRVRDRHFDINIKGTWNITKCVLPYMVKANYGKIVNLSSVTGPMVADAGEVAYATTKAALLGFTKSLAMEVVENNITVNAIMPGYILTPMVEGIAVETDEKNPQSVIQGIADGIPMGRLGTIEELGELAAFLASDESSYITGQGIVIDGGSTLPETKSVGV